MPAPRSASPTRRASRPGQCWWRDAGRPPGEWPARTTISFVHATPLAVCHIRGLSSTAHPHTTSLRSGLQSGTDHAVETRPRGSGPFSGVEMFITGPPGNSKSSRPTAAAAHVMQQAAREALAEQSNRSSAPTVRLYERTSPGTGLSRRSGCRLTGVLLPLAAPARQSSRRPPRARTRSPARLPRSTRTHPPRRLPRETEPRLPLPTLTCPHPRGCFLRHRRGPQRPLEEA